MPKKKKSAAAKKESEKTPLFRHLMKVVAATIILIAFVLLIALVVTVLIPLPEPAEQKATVMKNPAEHRLVFEVYPKENKPIHTGHPAVQHTGRQPQIAIIIDDVGYDKKIARQLIALDRSLTLSILPYSPFNREIAVAAHQAGNEVMLHLPMEPVEYPAVDPGQGVLLTSMAPDTLLRQLEEDIADIPYIDGVNNHMGSKLTTESTKLYQIFSLLRKQGLFFIDSRTTEKSLCGPSAGKLQLPFASRDVFLDNKLSEADIKRQLNLLVTIARHKGKAIGIAHPHPETLRVLQEQLSSVKERAQLVPASMLVETVAD